MNQKIIQTTGSASLAVQIITMIVDSYVLIIPTKPENRAFKRLLFIESVVNFVELTFYVWMVTNFSKIKNITRYRYLDWIFTTPTMLFTYVMYVLITYKKEKHEPYDLLTLVSREKYTIAIILVLNWFMLYFGWLGETGKMNTNVSTLVGFIPFIAMFYLIYDNYARHTSIGNSTFLYFVTVWGLYGFSALMSYKLKNVMYNILDLFAKNFFGLFLAYIVAFR